MWATPKVDGVGIASKAATVARHITQKKDEVTSYWDKFEEAERAA